jgi:ppGpp synthetase/RelA/SpoT-type nucleotidyltranferase
MRLESAQDGLEMEAQESEYLKFRRLAEYAASDILTKIQEVLNEMGDPFLFRARIDPWRIKSESSIARKAKERGWSPARALRETSDFLGLRLVCNNLQDVERVSAALTIALSIGDSRPKRQDYFASD